MHRTKKLLVRSTSVGSNILDFHKQTEKTLIRQLLQELPDLGLLCLQKREKVSLWGKGLKESLELEPLQFHCIQKSCFCTILALSYIFLPETPG